MQPFLTKKNQAEHMKEVMSGPCENQIQKAFKNRSLNYLRWVKKAFYFLYFFLHFLFPSTPQL